MTAKTPLNPLLAGALDAAKRGFRVHPGQPDSKKPILPGWPKRATTNAKQIGKWWGENPDANVAIATGMESGVIVVDVDGDEGKATMAELESVYGSSDTLTAKTPNGLHRYFLDPGYSVKNRTKFLPGLDLKADGGTVIAPPSSVAGKPYTWLNDGPAIPCPKWLLKAAKTHDTAKVVSQPYVGDSWSPLDGVPEGIRDVTIFAFACSLRVKGLKKTEAKELILKCAANCKPAFPQKQALAKLESAWKYSSTYDLNDLGNAKRFVSLYGKSVRYAAHRKQWLIRSGSRWRFDECEQIVLFAKNVVETIKAEVKSADD